MERVGAADEGRRRRRRRRERGMNLIMAGGVSVMSEEVLWYLKARKES